MSTAVQTTYPAPNVAATTWPSVANGESGLPASCVCWADKTIQVAGTFGVGGSVNIEGSNDGTNWNILHDPQGNVHTITAASIELIAENPFYIRPTVTAGDGSTALKVMIVARQS